MPITPFQQRLSDASLTLQRDRLTTLQVNIGRQCDLACRHCHLEAGPHCDEQMDRPTQQKVVDLARRGNFAQIDITGGAPELHPDLPQLLDELAPLTPRLLLRTNLTALAVEERQGLIPLFARLKVQLVASLPATNARQMEAQRGEGNWSVALEVLAQLNAAGYGLPDSELTLDLVANPSGAFLPSGQAQTEKRFRRELLRRHNLLFSQLYTFANAPLGRFRRWLETSGNLNDYERRLEELFNPCTLSGVMCRHQLSIRWDGAIFDCDFNLALDLPFGGRPRHLDDLGPLPDEGEPIAVGDHCYACTAGSGFT